MRQIFTFFFVFATLFMARASHIAGADLSYDCIGPGQYIVTLQFYRDCEGIDPSLVNNVMYSSAVCGSNGSIQLSQVGPAVDVSAVCPSQLSTCAGGSIYGIQEYTYQGVINLPPGCGNDWVLSYQTCCRNDVISTLTNSNSSGIFVSTTLDNTLSPCNSSPSFNNVPSSVVCVNQPVVYNHGVYDTDGDSLYFSLGNCLQSSSTSVTYSAGYSGISPLATASGVAVDAQTGTLTFTPTLLQVGVLCIKVEEFRNGVKIGEVNRDMQFNVIACTNTPPELSGIDGSSNSNSANFEITTCVNSQLCFDVVGSDVNAGDILSLSWNNEIPTAIFTTTGGTNPVTGQFCWTPTTSNANQSYTFTINVSDDACPVVGQSSYAYTIHVLDNPNIPVSAGGDLLICEGGNVLLNATTADPNVVSYEWSPTLGLSNPNSATTVAEPASSTVYTVTAIYADGCADNDDVLVTVQSTPSVSINPTAVNACSGGSVSLTAVTNQPGANFQWYNNGGAALGSGTVSGLSSSIVVTSPASPGSYAFSVEVISPISGCSSTDTATVNVAQVQSNVCNVLYVSPTGLSSNLGSPASPISLEEGLIRGACNGMVLKLAIGTYNIDNPLFIPSNITIEGGFDPGNGWRKTSQPGATTINRTTANPEGPANGQRLVAFYGNGANGFRFQDVTISTANANQPGMSTYGVHLTNCSNYDFVRTQILPGNAAAGAAGIVGRVGLNGVNGGTGQAGDNDDDNRNGGGGNGGAGGGGTPGGNGGAGGTTGANPGQNGGLPVGINGGGGAGGGSGGGEDRDGAIGGNGGGPLGNPGLGGNETGCNSGITCASNESGNDGQDGANGTNGVVGALGSVGAHVGGFWVPGGQGGTGTDGTGGAGGGGGGGGAGEGGFFCVDGKGSGGGGGGGGGQAGGGGTGGRGGGSSHGLYLVLNGPSGSVVQSNLSPGAAGPGGNGGNGGPGGNGGNGGNGSTYTGGEVGCGGDGGDGGDGGNGGAGGNGRPGNSIDVFLASGTALVQQETNFNLAAQAVITATDVSCTNTNMDYGVAASATWGFDVSATPQAPTGALVTTQYGATGRFDVVNGANTYSGFTNIIIENSLTPSISTSAPFINGAYRICAGSTVNFSANEGGASYVYNWDLGGGATPNTYNGANFESLTNIQFNTPGVYTIQLQYITNCCGLSVPGTIDLVVEEVPLVTSSGDQSTCGEDVTLSLFGTNSSQSILWTPASTLSSSSTNSVLASPSTTTTYQVTVADSSELCPVTLPITVTVNNLNLAISSTDVICINDGTGTVVPSGGSGSYSYLWSNGQNTATATNLGIGVYSVVVTDLITSCVDSASVFVNPAPTALIGVINSLVNETCPGSADGQISVTGFSGTAPYTYVWNDIGAGPATRNFLAAGNYTVTITDNLGCQASLSATISAPDSLIISIDSTANPSCATSMDGYMEISVEGGTPPYNVLWQSGQTGPVADVFVGVGNFSGFVTDASGCGSNGIVPNVQFTFMANPTPFDTIRDTVCQFQAYTLPGGSVISPSIDTTVTDTLVTVVGCDSIVTVFLEVDPLFVQNIDTTLCQGETLTVNGTTYSSSGVFNDTIRYVNSGCDSLQYVVNLQIDSFIVETIDTTICQGESLTVNGTTYTISGLYNDTAFYALSGCDSIQYVIDLQIDSFIVETIDTTICQGENLTVNGVTYTASGLYNDTAFYSQSGCDSILYVIDLQIDSVSIQNTVTTIAQGQSITVNGVIYDSTGIYADTVLYTQSGCDSIIFNIDLTVDSFTVVSIDTAICQGESLTVNGTTYTSTGNYNDTLLATLTGFDSIQYVINLQIDSFIVENIDTTLCQGESLTVNGVTYTSSGLYNDTAYYSLSGCDSVQYVIDLQIDSFIVENIDTTICQGQNLTVNGVTYTSSGLYNDTAFYFLSGCDSIQYVIDLQIDSFIVENIDTTICQGQSLTVNGVTYTSSGLYNDTAYYSLSGCDSIQYVIDLQIDSFIVENIDTTLCQGQSLTVNGVTYTSSGLYNDTAYYSLSGCDSVQYVIDLQIDSFIVENIDTTLCQGESLTVNGVTYTSSGLYNDTAFYSLSGCDSVQYVIDLQIDSFIVENIDTTLCQGESLTVNGVTYTLSGLYNDTAFYSQSACDSVQYVIDLQIDSFVVENIDTTICQGGSLTVNGITYTATGIYNDTAFHSQSGCDSIQYVIDLRIDSVDVSVIDAVLCAGDFITVNGVIYDTAVSHVFDTIQYVNSGCDSVIYDISVSINPLDQLLIDTTICQGESYSFNGNTYSSTGIYYDTLFGIDTTFAKLDSSISLPVSATSNVSYGWQAPALYSDYTSGGAALPDASPNGFTFEDLTDPFWTGNGVIANSVVNTIGYWDAAVPFNQWYGSSFSINVPSTSTYYVMLAADNAFRFSLDGTVLITSDGTQMVAAGNPGVSAQAIPFVRLHIYPVVLTQGCHIISIEGNNVGGPGMFGGAVLDNTAAEILAATSNADLNYVFSTATASNFASGTPNFVCPPGSFALGSSDCDSCRLLICDTIVTINLAIDSFVVENIDTTICQGESLFVNGVTYTATGIYNDTAFYSQSGCDSVQYVIDLQIDSFVVESIDTTLCQGQSLTVNGVTYTSSGLYNDTAFYALSGCDSVQYVIDLQIDSFVVENIDTTLCQGQSLTVNGVTYTSSGLYNDTAFYALSGCDSVQYVIDLQIDSFVVENIDTTICQGESLTVNGITYTSTGIYNDTAFYNQSGCDSVQYVIDLQIDSFVVESIDTTLCQGESLTVNGVTYTSSGLYNDTAFHILSGCDSIQYIIDLQIDSFVVENIDTTICQGESITVNGVVYNATGVYNDTLRYALSACDSVQFVIDLVVSPLPIVVANSSEPDSAACINELVNLFGSGTPGVSYTWDNGVSDNVPFNLPWGVNSFVVTGTDVLGCQSNDTIQMTAYPTFNETVNAVICEDENYTLPDGSIVNTAGTYTTSLNSVNACDSIIVTNLDVNFIGVFDSLENVTVCDGLSQTLGINASNITSFEWFVNDGSGNQSLIGNADYLGANTDELSFNLDTSLHQNIYSVVMIDECGNSYVEDLTLEVYIPQNVANPIADTTICIHENGPISIDYNGTDYEWSNGAFGPSVLIEESGEYIVNFVEIGTNCLLSDTINITIEDCIDNCVVLAPTAFSPNASGTNDIFRVITSCDVGFDFFEFSIYNRWGELVYVTDNWLEGWDGTYQGRNAEIATYSYTVRYVKTGTNKEELFGGNVTLIR